MKTTPETEKQQPQEEQHYSFPPCTQRPLATQNKLNGDFWIGFNPGGMTREVALAFAAFQIENFYAQLYSQMAVREQLGGGKKSMMDILTAPFSRLKKA